MLSFAILPQSKKQQQTENKKLWTNRKLQTALGEEKQNIVEGMHERKRMVAQMEGRDIKKKKNITNTTT